MGDTLIAEIAARISVVEIETEVQTLAGIHSKLGIDTVLTIDLVAAVVVEDTGIGRQGVHEEPGLRPLLHETVGLGEDEVVGSGTIDEDTAQARGVVASRGVVFAIDACVEHTVHKEVGQCVGLCRDHITELAVDGPYIESLGHLLVAGRIVVVLVEVLVLPSLGDVTHLIYLIIDILGPGT